MADLFLSKDAKKLLNGKRVLLIGDSNMRAMYKDLVCLLSQGSLLSQSNLRKKGEPSFFGDTRKDFSGLNPTRGYVEDRCFILENKSYNVQIEFNFTTTVYSKKIVEKLSESQDLDVLLLNSTLWDLTRWGPDGDLQFQKKLVKLLEFMKENLNPSTLVVWLTSLHPSSKETHSALVVKELDFIKSFVQFNVLEANVFAAGVVSSFGFNVLDLHYYTRLLCHRRRPDGIHYSVTAVRYNTNSVLTHIALSWQVQLPGRVERADLRRIQETIENQTQPVKTYSSNETGIQTKTGPPSERCSTERGLLQSQSLERQPLEELPSAKQAVERQDSEGQQPSTETPQRKILHAKRRLIMDDKLVDDLMSRSALDVIQESELLSKDLGLHQFFGPDY